MQGFLKYAFSVIIEEMFDLSQLIWFLCVIIKYVKRVVIYKLN
jgi:hypothetical protein